MIRKQPRILVITVASWNSKVGSNIWASLLENYDNKNIANICIRDEIPDSNVCSRYFNISENRIIKSVFNKNIKTGKEICPQYCEDNVKDLVAHNERYQKMQKKRRYSLLMARELVWKFGNWKTAELDAFLDSFKPDIILHSMGGYIHLNRIIEYAISMLIDILSGVLSGSSFLNKVGAFYCDKNDSMNVGYYITVIDTKIVCGDEYDKNIVEFVDLLRNSECMDGKTISLPGDDRIEKKHKIQIVQQD